MADEAPSLFSWLRSQVQRRPKGDGDDTPGSGGGLRLSRGMWIAVALAIVVVIAVLTSGNGGTPTTNAADSASPDADSAAPGSPGAGSGSPDTQAGRAPGDQSGDDAGAPGAASATAEHVAQGKTAYTRNPQGLIVRSSPAHTGDFVVRIEYDNPVTLICHTTGPKVYGRNGLATTLWDKVTTPGGKTGYVPDVWVLTEAEVTELVAPC
ncbi:hypothetical protein [Yinghuangia sp. YIM S09857]|uniref:SH3 domain-containing protein n=1 Tax=Yinghuangia sp. YIM S09857 TaxID=3436929 RepID=UPI003F538B33